MTELKKLAPKEVRYIKLGEGNCWAPHSLKNGEMHFGHRDIPHDICLAQDWDQVVELKARRMRLGKARDMAREVRDFYSLGNDCLWITFVDGYLWWAFAEPEVIWLGPEENGQGARMRKVIGRWQNTNIKGEELRINNLSSRLTQTAAYRQTLCKVKAADYLLRRINSIGEPVLVRACEARSVMIATASDMIKNLHWADFETMVDLIFTRSGWQRVSKVGGTQKDVDLVLKQQATDELAFIQVKSKANQAVLNECIGRYRSSGIYDRMFFVCHSPSKRLIINDDKSIHLWTGELLAEIAVKAGLYDWLMEKIS